MMSFKFHFGSDIEFVSSLKSLCRIYFSSLLGVSEIVLINKYLILVIIIFEKKVYRLKFLDTLYIQKRMVGNSLLSM